jgi:hypothetical protein
MKKQFRLSSLLWIVTLVCAACALVVESNSFIQTIAGSVIAANILGAIVALIVTHGFGLPRDGSFRHEVEDPTIENADTGPDQDYPARTG